MLAALSAHRAAEKDRPVVAWMLLLRRGLRGRLPRLSSRFPRGAAGLEQTGGERKGQRAVRLMEMLSEKHLPVLT